MIVNIEAQMKQDGGHDLVESQDEGGGRGGTTQGNLACASRRKFDGADLPLSSSGSSARKCD